MNNTPRAYSWPDGDHRLVLPMDSYLEEGLSLLDENDVVVLEADTGAGKTLRLAQAALFHNSSWKITLSQLRRNAVRWNGKRICQEMLCEPGTIVGWRLFGEDPVASPQTRLTLKVDQSIVNDIRRKKGQLPPGLLIIDEAHEQTESTALLLGMVKEGLAKSPTTKVVIMSATIDTKKFSDFFDGAPVLKVPGRCFPVKTEPLRLQRHEHHTQAVTRAAQLTLDAFLEGSLMTPTEDGEGEQAVERGAVIVLQPGKEEIKSTVNQLSRIVESRGLQRRVEVFGLSGESSPEEQDRIQREIPNGNLRFVVGTEIFRSSVTVEGTVCVIDSLRKRRFITDDKGVGHMTTVKVSKAEALQGAGRSGRTQPGLYIPCSFGQEFESGLPLYPTPSIQMAPVTSVALQVAAIGKNIRTFPFIDPPQQDKIDVAISRLRRVNALDEEENITERGKLLVRFPVDPERAVTLVEADRLKVLPEAVVVSAALEDNEFFLRAKRGENMLKVDEGVLRMLLARVKKSTYGYEWRKEPLKPSEVSLEDLPEWITPFDPFKDQKQTPCWASQLERIWTVDCGSHEFPGDGGSTIVDMLRKEWSKGSESDFVAIVNAYRAFKKEEWRLKDVAEKLRRLAPRKAHHKGGTGNKLPQPPGKDALLRAWCDRHFIHFKRLRMAEAAMRQIRDEVNLSPLRLDNGFAQERDFDGEALTKAIAAGHVDHVARLSGGNFVGPLGSFSLSYGSVCSRSSELVVTSVVRKIPAGRRTMLISDIAAPVKTEWLEEMMPHLCLNKRQGNLSYDEAHDQIVETEIRFFGNVEMSRYSVKAESNEAAAKCFARHAEYNPSQVGETLGEALRHNREIRGLAERLTKLSGESVVVEELAEKSYSEWLLEKLAGACSAKEIRDVSGVRLKSLDANLVEKIERESPKTLELLGQSRALTYSKESVVLELQFEEVMGHWGELPSAGVSTPGGRAITLRVKKGWSSSYSDTNPDELKRKVREALAETVWRSFSKPTHDDFNPKTIEEIPPLDEVRYGEDPLEEGNHLLAWGAVVVNTGWNSEDKPYQWTYFRDKQEAEAKRDEAVCHLEAALAEKRREEELQQQVAAGEALVDFEAWFREGGVTNNGKAWVVLPDGSLREPDEDHSPRFKSDGNRLWKVVARDELALRWSCSSIRDVMGNSEFEVVKLPVVDITEAQAAKVREIEEEIGALPGAFGLDPVETARIEALMGHVRDVFSCCPVCQTERGWDTSDYASLIGSDGFSLRCCEPAEVYESLDYNLGFDEECDGREAQVVSTHFVGETHVGEVLVYDKYGQWNANLRLRERRDGEGPQDSTDPVSEEPLEEIDPDSLGELFGGNARLT